MFTYSEDQLSQISALITNGNFPAAYRLAASFASGGEGVSQASILWMQGAANINENVGSEMQPRTCLMAESGTTF